MYHWIYYISHFQIYIGMYILYDVYLYKILYLASGLSNVFLFSKKDYISSVKIHICFAYQYKFRSGKKNGVLIKITLTKYTNLEETNTCFS